jgi:SAM-dependent methyltransferase
MSRYPRKEWKKLNKERYEAEAATLAAGGRPVWRVDKLSSELLVNRYVYRFLRDNSTKGFGQQALEVGSGRGSKTPYLVEGKAKLVGFDIAPRMAKLASESNSGSRYAFIAADAERLPFISESFDAAYFVDVLHHLPSIESVFEEGKRVLKHGGKVVVLDPNGRSWIAKMVRRSLVRYRRSLYAEEPMDPDKILDSLEHGGFTVTTKQFMCSIGYPYPHLVYRIPVPFKWLLYVLLPFVFLVDVVLSRFRNTAWMCGIVAYKPRS